MISYDTLGKGNVILAALIERRSYKTEWKKIMGEGDDFETRGMMVGDGGRIMSHACA